MKTSLNRRQFLKLIGTSVVSFVLQRCGIRTTTDVPAVATSTVPPVPSDTVTVSPTMTAVPSETATVQATSSYQASAAIGQVNTYEVAQLRQKLQEMFDQLGGLADVIRPGARVAIKPNLTGTTWSDAQLPHVSSGTRSTNL